MKHVLMTGATGYIGSRLARRLTGDGIAVDALLRPSSDRSRLSGLPGLTMHVHDGSLNSLISILAESRPDVVFHLAGKYVREHADADVADLVRANVQFGTELLEAMRASGANRLVHAATFFQHLDGFGYRPLNLYAATKQAFEDVLAYYVDADDVAAATLVLYDVYGSGDWRHRLIPAVLSALRTGEPMPIPAGDPLIDLVHVDDVSEAFIATARALMENPGQTAGRRYAVAADRRFALSEVLATFERIAGKSVPVKRGTWPAPARAIREPWRGAPVLGWRAKVSLDEGIRRLLAEA